MKSLRAGCQLRAWHQVSALKIELAIDQVAWEFTGGDACMAALKRDARRLAATTV